MKVLYLSGAPRASTLPTTESVGPRAHMLGVIDALRALGHDVDTHITGDHVAPQVRDGGSERRLGASPLTLLAADAGRLAYRLKGCRAARELLARTDYDLVYERYGLYQALGSGAVARSVPWVLEVNALLAVEATTTRRATTSARLAHRVERRTFAAADLLVTVTEELARQVVSHHGIDRQRIVVVPNGVDATRFPARTPRPAAGRPTTFGFVGTLYPWQNVADLVSALAVAPEERWELDIIGDGPQRADLEHLAAALDVAERVRFHGRQDPDAVPGLLAGVDACFSGHSSAAGTYFSPLKLWEYLAAGVPVVASAHTTTRALQADGYAVRCYDAGDPVSAAAVMRSVTDDLDALSATAVRGQARVAEEHSWRSRVEGLLAHLGTARVLA